MMTCRYECESEHGVECIGRTYAMCPQKKKLQGGETLLRWPHSYPDGRGERSSGEGLGCRHDIQLESLLLSKVKTSGLLLGGAAECKWLVLDQRSGGVKIRRQMA